MEHSQIHRTRTAAETQAGGERFGRTVLVKGAADASGIICLYGELGSGKTTFVQGLAQGLGITERILSPTFVLLRSHDIPGRDARFHHIDLYRLDSPQEINALGLAELLTEPGAVTVIEWADRLGDTLPERRTDIRFRIRDDGTHEYEIESHE